MKIVNIEGEDLHIFWVTWGMSMKFSGKTSLMIILKVTKNQGSTLYVEKTFLEKKFTTQSFPNEKSGACNVTRKVLH